MQIKVCGLRDPDNLLEVVSLQPDYIGLIFYPTSKRYIGKEKRMETFIKKNNSVLKVGVFVNAAYTTILDTIQDFGLHFVQLHGDESPDFCASLTHRAQIIKAFSIDEEFDFNKLNDYAPYCFYFLFDRRTAGNYGGTGKTFNWLLLHQYNLQKGYFLSGGISLENIRQVKAIKDPRLIGIDVNSCFETAPGLKDIYKIKTLIHELRN